MLRLADSSTSSAATLTPALRLEWDRATLSGAVSLSQFDSGSSLQGSAGGSYFLPIVSRVVAELSGSVSSTATRAAGNSRAVALVRGHVMNADRGVWAGAGGGPAHDGANTRAVRVAEVGAWSYLGPAAIVGTVTPTQVGTFRYTDGEAALRWIGGRAEVGLAGGARLGASNDDALSAGWASASAALWVTQALAVVASAGSYPVDFGAGTPGGQFVSVALRVGARPLIRSRDDFSAAGRSRSGLLESDRQASRNGVLAFREEPAGGGRQTFRLHAPGARQVEITGDFTLWSPVSLGRGDSGWWVVTLPVGAGVHEMTVRVDGGAWIVPPGLPAVRDEFGGTTGVLTVP